MIACLTKFSFDVLASGVLGQCCDGNHRGFFTTAHKNAFKIW